MPTADYAVARTVPDAEPYRPPPDGGLEIVHLESSFLVLSKPPGLLSEPGRGADKQDSLLIRAQTRFADVRIVHRLDMMTSGLLVLARGAAVHAGLSAAFRERRVYKRYEALVHGSFAAGQYEGLIELPLTVDWPNRPRQKVCMRDGKPSLTRYRVDDGIAAGGRPPFSRVVLEPVTGRTHQLRVHLAAIGHPIVGDPFYSDRPDESSRMMLHACGLEFAHPLTGAHLVFTSPMPF